MATAPGHGPHSYVIEEAMLTADRAPGRTMDIREAIAEINLFEHLFKPYMTGQMMIADTVDIHGLGAFQGTEKLSFRARYSDEGDGPSGFIEKKFVVTSIDRMVKTGDNTEVLLFSLTEEHYFRNEINVLSRAYEGKPSEIITNLVSDGQLGVEVETGTDEEIQGRLRYINPYITPLEGCERVLNAATTPDGYPYFLYSSIATEDKLQYKSLKELLNATPIANAQDPFRYSLYSTGLSDEQIAAIIGGDPNDPRGNNQQSARDVSLENRSRFIEKYEILNQQNLISLMQDGHFGAQHEFININEFAYKTHKHDMNEVYKRLLPELPADQQRTGLDDKAFDNIGLKDQQYISRIYANGTYSDQLNNIYDHGASIGSYLSLHPTSEALKAFMEKSAITIEIPGYHIWPNGGSNPNRTIGRKLPLKFFNNNIDAGELESGLIEDKQRSGEYFIYAAGHSFSVEKYSVSLTCVKYSDQNVGT